MGKGEILALLAEICLSRVGYKQPWASRTEWLDEMGK